MGSYEKEFEAQKAKINRFKKELKLLIKKYKLTSKGLANYNGLDEYINTEYFFVVNGETWHHQSIEEIVNESVK